MVEKELASDSLKEVDLDWSPKGHSHVPMHQKAFPLDDETTMHNVIDTGFNASYSDDDNGDVIEAVKSLDPYLHPKNQILLRALIKVNSIVQDISTLTKVPDDVSISEVSVKPLTIKEGLEIAQEMAPYLSSRTKHQVESVTNKLYSINKIKTDLNKAKTAETPEVKMEYILESLGHFIPKDKFNQIKQVVNIVKVFQTSNALSEQKYADEENEILEEDIEQKENEQLSDIMGMLDKFSNKNTE